MRADGECDTLGFRHARPAHPDATPRFLAAVKLADCDADARHGSVCAAERRFGMLAAAVDEAAEDDGFQAAGQRKASAPAVRRNKRGQVLCAHGRVLYRCVDCGGAGICVHKRRKDVCLLCKSRGKGKLGAGQGSGSSGGRVGGRDGSGRVGKQGMGIGKPCVTGGERRLGNAAGGDVVRRA
jgi:hypothetical protein